MISALYTGDVVHARLRPRRHRLRYRVFWLLLDLAELDAVDGRLRLFSRNRFNLLGFHDRDHGDGSGRPLREQIVELLAREGVDIGAGAVRLLTMPRVLGYVFNPISLYYCHRPDGRLAAMVYEVTSTFGERHAYVLPVAAEDAAEDRIRQAADKRLYVSPFMGMGMRYGFRGKAPSDALTLLIDGFDDEGLLIATAMRGRRRPLTDRTVLTTALSIPLLTLKVTAGIHWEALRLWLKGVPLTSRALPRAAAAAPPSKTDPAACPHAGASRYRAV
ncbi:DUF1365 domain-containing protein [Brevundimonas viscosa]|uniref:DUF1365 domain-containing protein n=1 Tax=Brevundimonas viscosa TaxID=871741 RepID=A0A1I6TBP4_9CAUL|nr:DUF1365 family protein [Brevundimonas viscosa]SFS86656.1 hypothetical protein SAMN05192570_3105 [Brevundimonas viscosa]